VSRKQCRIRLKSDFSSLPDLESFVTSCGFLEKEESLRALIVSTELFQNIVSYSRFPVSTAVDFAISRNDAIRLAISWATLNFGELVRASGSTSPRFDRAAGRYRGLGLLMCRNLSKSIQYKKGLFKSSVIIML